MITLIGSNVNFVRDGGLDIWNLDSKGRWAKPIMLRVNCMHMNLNGEAGYEM